MPTYDAGEISTNGISVPVQVDDQGDWVTSYGGRHLAADTKDKLKGKLARLTRVAKTEVEVRMVQVHGKGTSGIARKRGTATGLHGANGNVLMTWDQTDRNGKPIKEQISGYDYGTDWVAGDVTDRQLAEYSELVIAAAKAAEARDAWLRAHKVDPKTAVQRAIDAHLGQA